jgi:nicotinate-nucleotide--dimethylbenzimidazole phosphoribosyltransferase
LSIFGKDCPRCGETNAAYAVSCRCGFAFNSVDHVEEEEPDISVTIQEEELYLEYLTARAQQAAETAKRAASAAGQQPANEVAASQAQQAQVAADQAKAELEQQRARMKVTINGLADDRPGTPEQPAARPEQPASAAPAGPQSPAFSTTPASAPAKPITAPPVGERKQPATPAPKPAVAPPGVERKEPTPATVKSSGPAATDSKPTPPATVKSPSPAATDSKPTPPAGAKTPQDLNRYVPGADNARATTTGHSAGQATGHPARSQTNIPTGPASARPETKVQASALSTTNKVVPPAAKTSATQAVPTKPEHVPASKQPPVASASSTARPAPSGHGNVGAGPQVPRSAETSNKPATQGDAVPDKAVAAAARAKQLAEALQAAQAERAAKAKTRAATPSPNSKTGQEKPAASSESSAVKAPTPAQTLRAAAATSGVAATSANPANGQQQKLNGHDKPYADINAIPIPGTGPGEITLESDKGVSKQVARAPETVAEQPGKGAPSSSGRPAQKTNGTPRPMADSEKAAPAKPAPGVTVTATPGAGPQEELEAALKALSVRAPVPPASGPSKVPAHTEDAAVSPAIGDNPAPTAAPTPAPDGLPSLEPVTPANQKDCPNCTALLPMDAKRCRCGFRFPEIEETMPGLSLSDSDFAALDGDAPSDGITHLS